MEQNKLENQMKNKLNLREIQPSVQSWDRLDAMLTVAENKKPKKQYSWLYVAACFIAFLFVGSLFYNQESNNVKTNTHTVVEVNNADKVILIDENKTVVLEKIIKNRTEKEVEIVDAIKKKESIIVTKATLTKKEFVKNQDANLVEIAEEVSKIANQKVIIETNSTTLLATIENKTETLKTTPKLRLKIDPSTLLSEVNQEITVKYRQNAFITIVKKIGSAKEAIVSRNQE